VENQGETIPEITIDSADSMNQALRSLYENRLPELVEEIEACIGKCEWDRETVSKLFLMNVEEEYATAPTKILFVGRETFGWGIYSESDQVDDLMKAYESVSHQQTTYNSPFWWFRRDFSGEFGITEPNFRKATLWSNLSKIDVAKAKPVGENFGKLSQLFIGLLVDEIAIVKPDILLIMTTDGHYKWHVDNYGWLRNEPFNEAKPAELTRTTLIPKMIDHIIASGRLPEHTYQISHPNYLRRKPGGYKTNADELIKQLSLLIKAD
jgi:hypothetical protein